MKLICYTKIDTALIAGFSLVALVLLPSCSNRKTQVSGVLATVGSKQIRITDFEKEIQRRRAARQPIPDKDSVLNQMISFEALLQRAQNARIDQDPEARREIEHLLITKFLDRELTPKLDAIDVTAAEVKQEYQRRIAQYTQPAKVRLALLYLEGSPRMSDAKRTELRQSLEEARRRVLAHPPSGGRGPAATGFGALAIDHSEDQASRYRGGDIGWLEPGRFDYRWPRAILEAGYALDKGQVSKVIEAGHGFYLVMKTDARNSLVTPFARVEAAIRQSLLVRKRQEMESAFRQETVRLAGTKTNSEALAQLQMPSSVKTIAKNLQMPPAFPAGAARDN